MFVFIRVTVTTHTLDVISIKRASTAFGVGTGPIFLDNLACNSDDISLLECPYSVLHQCQHSDEAGVQCYGNSLCSGTGNIIIFIAV